ncbi:hypothetical protein CEE37_14200 [candidate division LCP-89 bacterium B3_LCP]|uniref:BioF2-like acetyltransferase domain-containing protein n=1 Tax=candidate division LCP-89 bacterium B3_LCP TaxID=2012998 RepID=A0A532UQQ5_UNCL8|nr:MAG: hypothetical protein CEE37_14200 [candidate division LCP-89 bacterium B3_LCP]
MEKLSYQIIRNLPEFLKLEKKWRDLLGLCPCHTIFQTWEWIATWLDTHEEKPYIICVLTSNDELVAILPFHEVSKGIFSILRLVGEPDSDYLDLIIKDGFERRVLNFFFDDILEETSSIGIVEFDSIHQESRLHSILNEKSPEGFNLSISKKVCPYISLPKNWDEFLTSLSSSTRYSVRRKKRKAEKDFRLHIDYAKTEEEFSKRMQNFIEQHQLRWQSMDKPGAFARDSFTMFHETVGLEFFRKGWARLYYLDFDNAPVATYYLFNYNNCLLFYLSGFDTAFAKYSPSMILMVKAIRDAIEEGMEEFDLMRGSGDYKFKWTSSVRENRSYKFMRDSFYVRTYLLVNRIIGKVARGTKYVPERLKVILRRILPRKIVRCFDPFFR